MPIQIIRNDITRMHVDAIVNTGNRQLCAGSGVNGAIHKAAGPQLLAECRTLGGCGVGEAKITRGYDLPCRYVIHTVSPVWRGGFAGEREQLVACYENALELAVKHHCRSIAFPMIGAGAHGYPKAQALRIATDTISTFLLNRVPDNDLLVYLVMFTKESLSVGSKLFADIRQYIDDCYVESHYDLRRESMRQTRALLPEDETALPFEICTPMEVCADTAAKAWNPETLEDALKMIDESFVQMVLRKIKEKGMKNADCYKKANIDKKLFSKIVNTPGYKLKKTTALALAVALELSLEETKELLMKAGLALSHSDKFDIIVEFFIMHGRYDIFEINEMLYDFDQALLGGAVL